MVDSEDSAPEGANEDRSGELDVRRRRLLDAAATVFLRFGFRKTSMEDVARASGMSRQGLYLHFATKEDLFRAAIQYLIDGALETATTCLTQEGITLEKRLVGAFDAVVGQFAGLLQGDAADLAMAAAELAGPLFAERERTFVAAVAESLETSGLVAAYTPAGLTARELAETLYATARGLKYGAGRTEFIEGMTVAVRAICLPLRASGANPDEGAPT
jgi:TetR/AcrR family transcriptional regulator, regulator of autoinduction and epiphytic fitness